MLAEPKISAMWLLSHPKTDCVFFIHKKKYSPSNIGLCSEKFDVSNPTS